MICNLERTAKCRITLNAFRAELSSQGRHFAVQRFFPDYIKDYRGLLFEKVGRDPAKGRDMANASGRRSGSISLSTARH